MLLKSAQAGTLESSDINITLRPADPGTGISIDLRSILMDQYGEQIQAAISETLTAHHITDALVTAIDRGALDCTIRARTLTALSRAGIDIKEAVK